MSLPIVPQSSSASFYSVEFDGIKTQVVFFKMAEAIRGLEETAKQLEQGRDNTEAGE